MQRLGIGLSGSIGRSFGKMKSAAVEQQPELKSLVFRYQVLSITRGGVGVGRALVVSCFPLAFENYDDYYE